MWESHLTNQKMLAALAQQNTQREQEAINARAAADMDIALARWTAAHPNFNEDQIIAVRKHAAEMNVINSLLATSKTPVDALVRSMDLGALDHPELRTVYLSPIETPKPPTQRQQSDSRKGKLNALSGSSGSAPRTSSTPRPMSDRDAIDQFAKELSDSFQNQ